MTTPAEPRMDGALPQNVGTEQAILGAMLLSGKAVADVAGILKPADFYRPAHEEVFATILDLDGRGEPTDPLAVAGELQRRGTLARVGGATALTDMTAACASPASAGFYARQVEELAVLRRLVQAGTRITQLGYATAGGVAADLVAEARKTLNDIDVTTGQEDDSVLLGDAVQEYLDRVESGDTAPKGWDWPWRDLNHVLLPLRKGQLVVFGGRPKHGKSTALLGVARHLAIDRQVPGVFFSLEMPKDEVIERIVCAEAKVPLTRMRDGSLRSQDWDAIAKAFGRLTDSPLRIVCRKASLADLRGAVRRYEVDFVAYDYLQLAPGCDGKDSSQRGSLLGQFAQGLKDLALTEDVAVLTAAQINRGPEQRADKRPKMADFRESGAIEQALDVAIMVHREEMYDKETTRAGEADFLVEGQRNGPTGAATVVAQLHFCRFVDMASA